ncbi:putative membrane protein [Actinacidiphila reveromycinica]|uniref:Putative membrane protein n=1 Tax=Actinacidiphila reveromycinica TaxID=659352 RepID=A0A7U3ULX2_9ACTN|nr:alkaline shock response membrane anchor protein AmaP [Streptomyces sp. SN-593]BBA96555.1 putative membrane protein [Streptomyces sp. SN-593]
MRTTLNRVMLGLLGLILLVVGLSVLVGSLDLQKHWNFTMPHWWPWTGPKDVLLSAHDRTRYRSDGWWWPVVIAALAVLLLIGLWWLFAQARGRRVRQIRVDSGDGQGALLRGRAVEDVLRSEAEAYDGVAWSGARLVGKRGNPSARLVLGLEPFANPREVVAGLDSSVLARARGSAGLDELPAEARLRAVRHRARRVS